MKISSALLKNYKPYRIGINIKKSLSIDPLSIDPLTELELSIDYLNRSHIFHEIHIGN